MITLPLGVSAAMVGPTVLAAVARDHGDDAVIKRAYGPNRFEIGNLAYLYRSDGELIDVYRMRINGDGYGRRLEIDHRTLKTRPRQLTYVAAGTDAFMANLDATDRRLLEHVPDKMETVYDVLDVDGRRLGTVAKVRHTDEEAGDRRRLQWYAVSAPGRFWCSYGEAREAAARWLLTEEAEGVPAVAIAA